MKFCPKCGAGIFNSSLPTCPMCSANLEEEAKPSDLFTRPKLPTKWAKIMCVILSLNAILAMIEGYVLLNRKTLYYLTLYELDGTWVESMEIFIGFGYFVFGVFTAISVYGILRYKKMGPIILYILHGMVIATCMRYIFNMYDASMRIENLHIDIMAHIHLILYTVLFPINWIYFRKRANVYDDIW